MKPDSTIILQASNLTFHYPGHALFSDWSADIPAGITVVRGGDGRGKSSLLQLMAGALVPQAGQLQIQGVSLDAQPEAYRQLVFWVDPRTDEFDQMLVQAYFASVRAAYPHFDEALLVTVIDGLGLTPHLDKHLYMLSTGSKRKIFLAAAFAAGATLILLDDPFAALDKASIIFVEEMLNQVASNPAQAWVIALYEVPARVSMTLLIDLGD